MPLYTDFINITNTVTDAAAINNAIKNILLTKIGNMPGKPTFGCDLDSKLFSQLDKVSIDIIKKRVYMALAKWEPRITVSDVSIKSITEYNKLVVTIFYQYNDNGLNINQQISVSFAK